MTDKYILIHFLDTYFNCTKKGTKSDMREKTPNSCVSRKEINELVKEIQARAYVECSAITNEGINEIFETAVKCILDD